MINSPVSLLGSGMAGGAHKVSRNGLFSSSAQRYLEKAVLCKPLWWALSHY